ncbi:hypothetical protein Tco_0964768, partial [Tanacetum coccineum]
IGTLVIAEHESGSLTSASLSSVATASKSLSKDNSLSLLLAGSGPSLQDAATNFASCHLSVSQASTISLSDGAVIELANKEDVKILSGRAVEIFAFCRLLCL